MRLLIYFCFLGAAFLPISTHAIPPAPDICTVRGSITDIISQDNTNAVISIAIETVLDSNYGQDCSYLAGEKFESITVGQQRFALDSIELPFSVIVNIGLYESSDPKIINLYDAENYVLGNTPTTSSESLSEPDNEQVSWIKKTLNFIWSVLGF